MIINTLEHDQPMMAGRKRTRTRIDDLGQICLCFFALLCVAEASSVSNPTSRQAIVQSLGENRRKSDKGRKTEQSRTLIKLEKQQRNRRMPKRSGTGSGSGNVSWSYIGCLGYSTSQLQSSWIFEGEAPTCGYTHHVSGGGGSSSGNSSRRRKRRSGKGWWLWSNNGGTNSESSSGDNSGNNGNSSSGGDSSNGSTGSDTGGSSTGEESPQSDSNGSGGSNSGDDSSGGGSNVNDSGNSSENESGVNDGNDNNTGGESDEELTNEDFDNEYEDDTFDPDDSDDAVVNGDDSNDGVVNDDNAVATGDDDNDGAVGDDNAIANDDNYGTSGDDNEESNGDDGKDGDIDGGDSQGNDIDDSVNEYEEDGEADDSANGDNEADYDPYTDFNVFECDTYESLWLWDLSLTCKSESSLESCECIFAEQLVANGMLSCYDKDNCPADCQICHTCFQLMGCFSDVTKNPGSTVRTSTLYVFLVATTILLLSGFYYYTQQRRKTTSALATHLIAEDASAMSSVRFCKPEPQVWLAPLCPPTQFQPSHKAAIDAYSDKISASGSLPTSLISSRQEEEVGNVWLAPMP